MVAPSGTASCHWWLKRLRSFQSEGKSMISLKDSGTWSRKLATTGEAFAYEPIV
jgi:hypothetical protein